MGHQINLLHSLFQDPINANIHWREIVSLLHHLGATVEPSHGARFHVELNKVVGVLHHPHQGGVCSKQEIKHLREFLLNAGINLADYESVQK